MAIAGLMTLSTVLLTLLVRKTAEQRHSVQSHQPGQQIQRQKLRWRNSQQIIGLNRQVVKQPSSISKKFRQNPTIMIKAVQRNTVKTRGDVDRAQKKGSRHKKGQLLLVSTPFFLINKFHPIILRNKSGWQQFIRLRKLLGQTSSEKMKEISYRERARLPLQWLDFGHRPFDFSNRPSIATKINTTSHLLILSTPSTPSLQNESNFSLKSENLKSLSLKESLSKFLQDAAISTVDIFDDKNSTLPLEQQSTEQKLQHVTLQNVEQTSAVTESTLPLAITAVEVQTSSPFTVQHLLPTAEFDSNFPQSLSNSVGPPGFLPPNDEVITQLNNAQNFHALAEVMELKRHFIRNGTN